MNSAFCTAAAEAGSAFSSVVFVLCLGVLLVAGVCLARGLAAGRGSRTDSRRGSSSAARVSEYRRTRGL